MPKNSIEFLSKMMYKINMLIIEVCYIYIEKLSVAPTPIKLVNHEVSSLVGFPPIRSIQN